jgi:hypothetical protein
MKMPRLTIWALIAAVLLAVIALLFPQQLAVVAFKGLLVSVAGVGGYYLDRSLFPYARPDGYLALPPGVRHSRVPGDPVTADYPVCEGYNTVFAVAMLRRAVIIGCAMLAVGLGA